MTKKETIITVGEIHGTQTLIEHPGVDKQLCLQCILSDDGLEFNRPSMEDIEEFCMHIPGGTQEEAKMYDEFFDEQIESTISQWEASDE